MKNRFSFLFFVLTLCSCFGKNRIPNDVLPQKEMVSVVWDLLRADEFLSAYVLPKDTSLNKKDESARYYEEIFKLHQTNKKTFQKSFTFYQSHPTLMKQLLDSLNAKGNAVKLEEDQPKLTDSSLLQKIHPKAVE